ncbi:MAG: hypothetical protein ABW110_02970 [Steroidobacteraceae bacterium]
MSLRHRARGDRYLLQASGRLGKYVAGGDTRRDEQHRPRPPFGLLRSSYRCGADEAVILEVTPPQAPWWSIQLTSHFWEALDWNLRQTSINGHQAVLDPDGKFRAVIAHVDLGVPNWQDAGGHEVALITARYYKAKSTPLPQLRTVPLKDVRRELPPTTRVITPRQRQASLWNRAQSVPRRLM